MAVKEVTCMICGNMVSKRKSLSFGDGRACREHSEVIKMIDERAEAELRDKMMAQVDENMKVITLSSFVQVSHSLRGVPLVMLFMMVRDSYGKDMEKKVRAEVDKRGATLEPAEMVSSLVGYLNLVKEVDGV